MTVFAMVFPGQGSQKVGMLKKLAMDYKVVKTTFKEASTALDYDLWQLVQHGPIDELNKTWLTQPAILASSVAIWRVWQQHSYEIPTFMAGHSLGEYSALVCAESLDFVTAITLVALRGRLMQEAVPRNIGAMAAIVGLNKNVIIDACKQAAHEQIVTPVNFNSPDQVVIAGHKEAVKRACLACKKAGAKYVLHLPISIPSHCILMKPAAEKLAVALETIKFSTPQIQVFNNVDVRAEQNPMAIRNALVRQLYSPVRWVEIIRYFASYGVKVLIEAGPGKVLTNLTKQIDCNLLSAAINDPASLAAAMKY